MKLQHCTSCGTVQYPPRELCAACLSDTLEWRVTADEPGELLANTVLQHSHEPEFRTKLPLHVGLVRVDIGPRVVCFLADPCPAGTRVNVSANSDNTGRTVLSAANAKGSFAAITKGAS